MANDENGIDWKVEIVEWRNRYHAALKLLADRDKPCVWTQDTDKWYMTACENAFAHMQGSYCPGCGHPIRIHGDEHGK